MRTYNCIFCSFFVQLQELLQCQVSRIFLKGKKTTACRVFFVFLPEKSKKKIKKHKTSRQKKKQTNHSQPQFATRHIQTFFPAKHLGRHHGSTSTAPAHLHAGAELPSETAPRCPEAPIAAGGRETHPHTLLTAGRHRAPSPPAP